MAFISYAAVRLAQNRRSSAGFPPRRLLLRTYLDQRADARSRSLPVLLSAQIGSVDPMAKPPSNAGRTPPVPTGHLAKGGALALMKATPERLARRVKKTVGSSAFRRVTASSAKSPWPVDVPPIEDREDD